VRVARCEQHAAKALKVRVLSDLLHEPPRQTFASMLEKDVNVRKIGERCLVGYDASKTMAKQLTFV
jgi:hypothetical protein